MAETSPPFAVVIGLDSITGLQTSRALARRGIPVVGIANNAKHYCCRTNSCRKIIEADTTSDDLVHLLVQLGRGLATGGVIFPCTDISVLTVSENRDQLEKYYPIDLPDHDTVTRLLDKAQSCQFVADVCGFAVPRTWGLRNLDDMARAGEEATFPCILKPAVKNVTWEQQAPSKTFLIRDAVQLRREFERCAAWCDELLLQEWIEGSDDCLFTCNAYFDAYSRPLATFTTRKIRQWPPRIGTSCFSVEDENEDIVALTHKLFRTARFSGLAYAEWKWDKNRGKFFFIEANVGRPTGRSAMAEAAGVELVKTKYCHNLKLPLPRHKRRSQRLVQWVHWRRDLQSALYYWWRGELSLGSWWQSRRGQKAYAVLDRRDIRPFLAEMCYIARKSAAAIWPWSR